VGSTSPQKLLDVAETNRAQNKMLYEDISVYDPEVNDIIEKETWRQFSGLELIASEVSINGAFLAFWSRCAVWPRSQLLTGRT
jgi:hypothetical protein